jgi:hypothetical protein
MERGYNSSKHWNLCLPAEINTFFLSSSPLNGSKMLLTRPEMFQPGDCRIARFVADRVKPTVHLNDASRIRVMPSTCMHKCKNTRC